MICREIYPGAVRPPMTALRRRSMALVPPGRRAGLDPAGGHRAGRADRRGSSLVIIISAHRSA